MQPTARDRKKVNDELKRLGFGGLEDRNLCSQIAFCLRTHEAFRGMLMAAHPSERANAYRALAPHICHFTPRTLEDYERETKEKAEREQWDTWNGTAYPDKFKVQNIVTEKTEKRALEQVAEKALAHGALALVCADCLKTREFLGMSRNEAVHEAYKAGWRWDRRDKNKAFCPEHAPDYVKSLTDLVSTEKVH